jgi:hypothetical protein
MASFGCLIKFRLRKVDGHGEGRKEKTKEEERRKNGAGAKSFRVKGEFFPG